MEFSRQEYWGGLPSPPPGDLPDPEIKSESPALADRFFTTEPPEKPIFIRNIYPGFSGDLTRGEVMTESHYLELALLEFP